MESAGFRFRQNMWGSVQSSVERETFHSLNPFHLRLTINTHFRHTFSINPAFSSIKPIFQPFSLISNHSYTSALVSSPYYPLRPTFNLIQSFSGTTAHFQASISTHNVHNYFLLFFCIFNPHHMFLPVFNCWQPFSNPTMRPHTYTNSLRHFRDQPPTFNLIHLLLTLIEPFHLFFTNFHQFPPLNLSFSLHICLLLNPTTLLKPFIHFFEHFLPFFPFFSLFFVF